MSLPPNFLDELRTRLSLSQVVGRKVMWDQRKSNQGKGDMWAPCPFHQEKSASFHVDDRKGFYYCFGCHAKGDAISFVRETENVGFMEAVEILAGEAGMPMPARDPKAQEKADLRTELTQVMEQAAQFFIMQLKTGAGAAARDYLDRRRMTDATRDTFGIGFAPDGWQGLWDHLRGKGVSEQMILDCGLAKASSKGGKPYDTFRNRIMFPIRDARGRCIAFGGRAMDPNDNAKYLNSPETLLFDKGRNLYNMGPARAASGKGAPLIVAEGYMDVIALSAAGFGASVAPLGTAVTEDQLHLMWRISDEPLIALDGDTAGMRAAYRVIDLALPLLEAGKSLRFAVMPPGKDPDDLIRVDGAAGLQKVLDAALPMVSLLWQRETEGQVFDSPERRAALDKVLREKIMLIRDPSVRGHYGEAIKELRWELFRTARRPQKRQGAFRPGKSGGKFGAPSWQVEKGAGDSVRNSMLVAAGESAETRQHEAVVLAALVTCPDLIEEFEPELEQMHCADPTHAILRDQLLRHAGMDAKALRAEILHHLGPEPLETLLSARHVAVTPCIRRPGNTDLARMTVAEQLAKLSARAGHQAELAEAEEDLEGPSDEAVTWRLGQAANARHQAERSQQNDRVEYDVGPNGARIDRDERSALDALLERIEYAKRGS
ncbi:DNA primase [Primorskyibacter flagellatus]|uniref:DNA primase n=1 Tax=Primorskyibacter flagellatus TaxID=1387277 RepID=A0A1W2B933_9RHOB|nr:DNA primase [Primorskyibacter flagellatus]SMC69291.1 DNA primase [Primorskyibacter flagellatus]